MGSRGKEQRAGAGLPRAQRAQPPWQEANHTRMWWVVNGMGRRVPALPRTLDGSLTRVSCKSLKTEVPRRGQSKISCSI